MYNASQKYTCPALKGLDLSTWCVLACTALATCKAWPCDWLLVDHVINN